MQDTIVLWTMCEVNAALLHPSIEFYIPNYCSGYNFVNVALLPPIFAPGWTRMLLEMWSRVSLQANSIGSNLQAHKMSA